MQLNEFFKGKNNQRKLTESAEIEEVTRRDMPDMNAGWQAGPRRKISVRKAIEILSRYAERELQKELRWAKGDEEMEDDARDEYQQYVKLIDLMKSGDLNSAKQFWNDSMNHILVNDSTFPVTVRDVLESKLAEGNPESKQKRRTVDRTVGQNWMDQQNSFSDFERKTTSPIRMGRGVNRFAKSDTYNALAKGEMAEAGMPDLDHMQGKRGIGLDRAADTRDILQKDRAVYTDQYKWDADCARVNSELLDDTADFTSSRYGMEMAVGRVPIASWNHGERSGYINVKAARQAQGSQDVNEDDAELDASKILKLLDGLWRWLHHQGIPSETRHPGRVWTRGDGVRSRDPAQLKFFKEEACDRAWALITALPGAKPTSVSGQFGSSAFRDAVLWKNKLLIKNSHSIEIGTKSRITNPRSVWREKPRTNEASEILKPGSKVMFAHKGKTTSGEVVRYDAGGDGGSPFYVVYVKGEVESPIVPAHRVKPVQTAQLGEVDMGQADRTLRSGTRGDPSKMAHTLALRKAAEQMGYAHWADVPDSELDQLHALAKKIKGVAEGNISEDSDWELEPIDKQDNSAGEHRQQYPFHNIKKESTRMANPPAGMSAREYAQHERGRAPKPKLRVGAKVSTPRGSGTVKSMYTKQLASGKSAQFITIVDRMGAEHEVRVRQGEITVREGYTVIPKIDAERYGPRDGLEGPFTARNGMVVYYDPIEGRYYDPNTDIYIDHEDWHLMNEAESSLDAHANAIDKLRIADLEAVLKNKPNMPRANRAGIQHRIDSIRSDIEARKGTKQISEGPFKGVGKMMMKRKLKKGEADSMKRAETAYFDHEDQDEFMSHMADRRKKEKALDRLTREGVKQVDEISPALKKSYIAKAPKTVAPLVDKGRELRKQGDEEAGMKQFDKAANRVSRLNRLHNQELDAYRKTRDSSVHFALRDGKDPDAK